MALVHNSADSFAELFHGNQSAYGEHIPEKNPVEGQKAKGKSSHLIKEQLTRDVYLQHLHGEKSIGVSPIMSDNNMWFGAIDIDVYPLDPAKYLRIIQIHALPLVLFRSKSGGLHLYIFFDKAVPAVKAVPLLQNIRGLLGLKPKTEVFPKQTRITPPGIGNWINLPYYDHSKTVRYAYGSDGSQLSLEDAISKCMILRTNLKDLTALISTLPMADAPPCLQTIRLNGGAKEGERNMFLFNCAVYMKSKFKDDYAENMHKLNERLDSPMGYAELDTTIIASHNRKEYTYACKDPILAEFCDKTECGLRAHGMGSGSVSDLNYGELRQLRGANSTYTWMVDGVVIAFDSESQLLNFDKFTELCVDKLNRVPKHMSKPAWKAIVGRSLQNITIVDVGFDGDLSTGSIWLSKVDEFFARTCATRREQVMDGQMWYDPAYKRVMFRGPNLLEYLMTNRTLDDFTPAKHKAMLKMIGCRNAKLNIGRSSVRVWALRLEKANENGLLLDLVLPEGKVNNVDKNEDKQLKIDYTEKEEKF